MTLTVPNERIAARCKIFIERWAPSPKCVELACHHLGDKGASTLDSVTVGRGKVGAADITQILERFDDAAAGHVETADSRQRYAIAALNSKGRVLAQAFFALTPAAEDSLIAYGDSDPPTAKGQIKQTLRHNESMHRYNMLNNERVTAAALKLLERMDARVTALEERELDVAKLAAELSQAKSRMELDVAKEATKMELQTAMWARFESDVLPAFVARVVGATDAAELLQSLPAEQRKLVHKALDQEGRKRLARIYDQAEAGKRAQLRFLGRDTAEKEKTANGQ